MEPYGALRSEVKEANCLKDMVGTRGLEPLTSTVSTFCGTVCGSEIWPSRWFQKRYSESAGATGHLTARRFVLALRNHNLTSGANITRGGEHASTLPARISPAWPSQDRTGLLGISLVGH